MITSTDLADFLTRTRGRKLHWTDVVAYAYLAMGVLVVLLPVTWMIFSSVKSQRALVENDPRLLPYEQVTVAGSEGRPLSVFAVKQADGTMREVAFLAAKGRNALVAPVEAAGDATKAFEVPRIDLVRKERIDPQFTNYTDPMLGKGGADAFPFLRYFWNSTFVTVVATLLTLLVNAMAAFALSKYRFRGRDLIVVIIVSTLLIPPTVILVPLFITVQGLGLFNKLWGVIVPAIASPTGVFLLRQYMLTIPDELLEAARMDAASEWKIFWRIIVPLSAPALAVLAILSVIWRWNDFMWPLIVLTKSEVYTLQLGLSTFKGEIADNMHHLLAMTVLTLLPVTLVFVFLQKHITAGIANTGLK